MTGVGRSIGAAGLLALLALLALGSCRAPLLRAAAAPSTGSAPLPEPGPPALPEALDAFFSGLSDARGPLARLRAAPSPPGAPPRLVSLPEVEAAVRWRFARGAPGGALREALALGVCAWSPLPPRAMADLLANAEAERRAFRATTFRPVAVRFHARAALRQEYHVEMLDVGEGPIRFDFRFRAALERWDLVDGGVLLRYDPVPWSGTTHVTLFRGMAHIEPADSGSLVTELLLFGSDVTLPFFLQGKLRQNAVDTFRGRLDRLWEMARGLAAR